MASSSPLTFFFCVVYSAAGFCSALNQHSMAALHWTATTNNDIDCELQKKKSFLSHALIFSLFVQRPRTCRAVLAASLLASVFAFFVYNSYDDVKLCNAAQHTVLVCELLQLQMWSRFSSLLALQWSSSFALGERNLNHIQVCFNLTRPYIRSGVRRVFVHRSLPPSLILFSLILFDRFFSPALLLFWIRLDNVCKSCEIEIKNRVSVSGLYLHVSRSYNEGIYIWWWWWERHSTEKWS